MAAAGIAFLTAVELGDLLRRRQASSEEIVTELLGRIDRLNAELGAFITVCGQAAIDSARRADRALARGKPRSPLHGVPFAVKDALWTEGVRTTNGSRLFADFVPREDATAVARLRAAGGVLLGKLNMTELAFGGTLAPPFGMPRNPWDPSRTTGGSSSGSASALAAGLCPITLGGDTGGSIRLPASFCGVVGLKPTWGRVSRHGLMPLAEPFDCAGPLGRTAQDVALALQVIAGRDAKDATSSDRPVPDYARAARRGARGMRVGVIRELMESDLLDSRVARLVVEALDMLKRSGAAIEEVSIPLIRFSSEIYVATAEPEVAARYRRDLVQRAGDIDVLPRRRLLSASLVPAALRARILPLREALQGQVDGALRSVDVLAAPTAPTAATPIAEPPSLTSKEEAWLGAVAGRSLFTNPFNVTAHPALSVPCGFTAEGLPVGLQLAARPFREDETLRIAAAYQAATDWHRRHPEL